MKTIHKYQLEGHNVQSINLPAGAKILAASHQADNIMLWALVDTDNQLEMRKFGIWGTGHNIDTAKNMRHIDTVFIGGLVFHVFELLDEVGTPVASTGATYEAIPIQPDNKPRRKKSSI